MKTVKHISVVIAGVLGFSVNVLNAATSTNRPAVVTSVIIPVRMSCGDAANVVRVASATSTNLSALVNTEAKMTVSTDTQNFSAEACCSEIRTAGFTLQTDALAKMPGDASVRRTVRYFSDAAISVSRSSNRAEWRDGEPGTFSHYQGNVSWAGGDAAARREPRGLKLFSWSW